MGWGTDLHELDSAGAGTQQHRSSFFPSAYIEQWTSYLPTDFSTIEAIASTMAPWASL